MLTDFFEKKRKERERLQQKELQKRQLQTVKKVAIGTILGSIAGAVSGVLFAPKSGKETRKDIADAAKNVAGNVKENISDAMDVAKQKADNITREIKSKYSEFVDRNMTELKGIDPERLRNIGDRTLEDFFKRYFEECYKLLAALGAVRIWDDRIGVILDRSDWCIPEDSVPELRVALKDAESKARRRFWGVR